MSTSVELYRDHDASPVGPEIDRRHAPRHDEDLLGRLALSSEWGIEVSPVESSRFTTFNSGAYGITNVSAVMRGPEDRDYRDSRFRVTGERTLSVGGNLLILTEAEVLQTINELETPEHRSNRLLAPKSSPLHPVQNLMRAIEGQQIGGVRYNACITASMSKDNKTVIVRSASEYIPEAVSLQFPKVKEEFAEAMGRRHEIHQGAEFWTS